MLCRLQSEIDCQRVFGQIDEILKTLQTVGQVTATVYTYFPPKYKQIPRSRNAFVKQAIPVI